MHGAMMERGTGDPVQAPERRARFIRSFQPDAKGRHARAKRRHQGGESKRIAPLARMSGRFPAPFPRALTPVMLRRITLAGGASIR